MNIEQMKKLKRGSLVYKITSVGDNVYADESIITEVTIEKGGEVFIRMLNIGVCDIKDLRHWQPSKTDAMVAYIKACEKKVLAVNEGVKLIQNTNDDDLIIRAV